MLLAWAFAVARSQNRADDWCENNLFKARVRLRKYLILNTYHYFALSCVLSVFNWWVVHSYQIRLKKALLSSDCVLCAILSPLFLLSFNCHVVVQKLVKSSLHKKVPKIYERFFILKKKQS